MAGGFISRVDHGPNLECEEAVAAYERLAEIERGFRAHNSVDLTVRPKHHCREGRVREHVFLCMLAW